MWWRAQEDYSFRARGAHGALGELSMEVNALADLLGPTDAV